MNALSATDILTQDEVQRVLLDLDYRARHRRHFSKQQMQNRVIFRLSACCGLRASEIAAVKLGHITTSGPRPAIRLPRRITKGRVRGRTIPLWWDSATLVAINEWINYRRDQHGATNDDCLVVVLRNNACTPMDRKLVRLRFLTAIRCLGKARVKQLSVHSGRHSFASHALNVGHSLAEVQNALGHANISTTSVYVHLVERGDVPDLFPRKGG